MTSSTENQHPYIKTESSAGCPVQAPLGRGFCVGTLSNLVIPSEVEGPCPVTASGREAVLLAANLTLVK
jgi:hypothetical protein